MPTVLPSNPISFPKVGVSTGLSGFNNLNQPQVPRAGVCQYIFTKSHTNPNRPCDKPAYNGTRYCKSCWTKKTVQSEAAKNGESIPQEIVEKQKTRSTAASVATQPILPFNTLGRPTTTPGFPTLPTALNNVPTTNLTGAIFNPLAGRPQVPPSMPSLPILPQAPVQTNNPFQVGATSATSLSYLDEKMHTLGIDTTGYDNIESYVIGNGNIIYTISQEDPNKPERSVGVLDVEHRNIRPLLDNEKHLTVPGTTYDPSLMPTKATQQTSLPVQPTMPAFSLVTNPVMPSTGFKATLPLGVKPNIPSFIQPSLPKTNTLPIADDEADEE